MNNRTCLICSSDKSTKSKGYENWYKYKDGYLCHKCYSRLIGNPRRDPALIIKWNKITAPKRMRFKDKRITLKQRILTGICKLCNKKGLTNMHHIEYHDDDPLKDTIELCVGCHRKQHARSEWG